MPSPALRERRRRLLELGARLLDRGRAWHAHEAWEAAWRQDPAPHRDGWKALIQHAAARHHRRDPRVAAVLLGRAARHEPHLGGVLDHHGAGHRQLIRWCQAHRAWLLAGCPGAAPRCGPGIPGT